MILVLAKISSSPPNFDNNPALGMIPVQFLHNHIPNRSEKAIFAGGNTDPANWTSPTWGRI